MGKQGDRDTIFKTELPKLACPAQRNNATATENRGEMTTENGGNGKRKRKKTATKMGGKWQQTSGKTAMENGKYGNGKWGKWQRKMERQQ